MRRKARRAMVVVLVLSGALALALCGGWWWRARGRDPTRLAGLAERLVAQGNVDAALAQYERAFRVARAVPQKTRILMRMAEVLLAAGETSTEQAATRFGKVLGIWGQVAELSPADSEPGRKLLAAVHELALADSQWWPQVHPVAEAILRVTPDDAFARLCRAMATLESGKWQQASAEQREQIRNDLEAARLQSPDDYRPTYYLAVWHLRQSDAATGATPTPDAGTVATAMAAMAEYVRQHPGQPGAQVERARLLLRQPPDIDQAARFREADAALLGAEAALLAGDLPDETLRAAALIPVASPMAPPGSASAALAAAQGRSERLIRYVLTKHPDRLNAKVALAQCLEAQDRLDEALAVCQDLRMERRVRASPGALVARQFQVLAIFQTGRIALRRWAGVQDAGERAAWVERCRGAVRELKSVSGAPTVMAEILEAELAYADGRYLDAANRLYALAQSSGIVQPDLHLYCGLALARLGENGKSLAELQRFLRTGGPTPTERGRAALELLRVGLRLRAFDEVAQLGAGMRGEFPLDQELAVLTAQAMLGQAARAPQERRAEVAVALAPVLQGALQAGTPGAELAMAEAYVMAGRQDTARELLEGYCRKSPSAVEAQVSLLRVLHASAGDSAVRQRLSDLVGSLADDAATRLLKEALGRPDTGYAELERLAGICFEAVACRRLLGLYAWYSATSADAAAAAVLAQAAALAPGDDQRAVWRTQVSRALSRREWDVFEGLARAAAGSAVVEAGELEYWRARAMLARGEVQAARTVAQNVVARWPLYSDAWVLLGAACREAKLPWEAEKAYKEALALKPDHVAALGQVFQLCDERGATKEALAFLQQTLVFSSSPAALQQFLDYAGRHDKKLALDSRTRLDQALPPTSENRRAIARLTLDLGQPDAAKKVLDELLREGGKDRENLGVLADYHRQTGHPEVGKKLLTDYLGALGAASVADDWLVFARYLRDAGDGAVADAYSQALTRGGAAGSVAARELVDLYVANRQFDQAVVVLVGMLERQDEAEVRLRLASVLASRGRYDEARQYLEVLRKQTPEDPRVVQLQGEIAAALGQADEAVAAATRAVEKAPDDPMGYLNRARLQARSESAAERAAARADVEKALALRPGLLAARELLIQLLVRDGKLADAVSLLQRLSEQATDPARYRLELGRLYLRLGRYAVLEEELPRWLRDAPEAPEWCVLKAGLLAARGDVAGAAREYRTAFERQKDAPALRLYASAVLDAEGPDRARQLLDEHADLTAAAAGCVALRARTLAGLGRTDEAVQEFVKAARLAGAGELPAVFSEVRATLDPAQALAVCRALRPQNPSPVIWQHLIHALAQMGSTEEAQAELRQFQAAHPASARTALLEATVAAGAGRPDQALAAVAEALRLDPTDPACYVLRAQLRFAAADSAVQDEVRQDLDRALELSPDLPSAREMLAEWLARRGRWSDAIEQFSRLVQQAPAKAGYRIELCQALLASGQADRVASLLGTWSTAAPDWPEWHLIRARLYRAQKRSPSEILREYESFYSDRATPEALAEYAGFLVESGEPERARELVEKSPYAALAAPRFLALKARLLAATGRDQDAVTALRAALLSAAGQDALSASVVTEFETALGPAVAANVLQGVLEADSTGVATLALGRLRLQAGEAEPAIGILVGLRDRLAATESALRRPLLLLLGNAYRAAGRHLEAKEAFGQALALAPGDLAALNNLAYVMAANLGEAKEAVPLAERAVKAAEGQPETTQAMCLDTLGYARMRVGLRAPAEEALRQSLRLADRPAVRLHLAEVLLAGGSADEARGHLQEAEAKATAANDKAMLEEIRQMRARTGAR